MRWWEQKWAIFVELWNVFTGRDLRSSAGKEMDRKQMAMVSRGDGPQELTGSQLDVVLEMILLT